MINHQNAQHLEELFSFVPPSQLLRTVQDTFFAWLVESPVLPKNYKQISEDVYFLLLFLECMKEE